MTQPTSILFLSHSGLDKDAAINLRKRLLASQDAKQAGLKIWLDVEDLDVGKPWQPQLEKAIGEATAFAVIVGSHGIRNWVRAETDLANSRAIKDESFRLIPILQDGGSDTITPFVRRFQAVRDPLTDPEAMQLLLRAVLDRNESLRLTEEPFPGLRSMSEDWADRFFGRREETDNVLAMLRRHRAVTIVADSGAGKSSLAMAGVGHAWRGGGLYENRPKADDLTIWHIVTMRPAENPIEQLRNAIETAANELGHDQTAITYYRKVLTSDPSFALRCGLDPDNTHTLLIIDQAEELVTLTPADRRPEFGHIIAALAEAMGDRLRILITLRSDHLNLVSKDEKLGQMICSTDARFNLKQPVDLAEIVRSPLALAGYCNEVEQEALIGRLLEDLSDRPSNLALVQVTLSLAWRDRSKYGGLLGAYSANGGALKALGQEAERIERLLSTQDTKRLMPIFIRLIRLSEVDTGATRRIALRDEFDDAQNDLIDRLAGEECGRLIQTSATYVEIAHEALITQWPTLHEYLIEHAGALRNLADLMRRAQGWAVAKESTKHLTSLADEETFQALKKTRLEWLAPVERRFLEWSKAEHQRIRDEREAEIQARDTAVLEREHAIKKGKRAIHHGLMVASLLLVLLLGAAWLGYKSNQSAELQSAIADQSRADALVVLALAHADTNPVDALKLVLGAWPESNAGPFPTTNIAFQAISEALSNTLPHAVLYNNQEYAVTSVAFSPQGNRLVTGSSDGTLRLWNADMGTLLAEPIRGHAVRIRSIAFSPDGSRFLSIDFDGTMRLWNAATGLSLGKPMRRDEERILSAAFSPNGSRLVSGGGNGTLRFWDAATSATIGWPLLGHEGSVYSVAFSPDGSSIISGSTDATLRLWDTGTRQSLGEPIRGHMGSINDVTVSPDGSRIISGGDDGTLRIWDTTTREALVSLRAHEDFVSSVDLSPNGRLLVSGGGYDGSLRLWSATSGQPLRLVLGHEGWLIRVAFSPNGHFIASGGLDGTLRLWDATAGTEMRVYKAEQAVTQLTQIEPGLHEVKFLNSVETVAFSPDGSSIISGGNNGTLRLWDTVTGKQLVTREYESGISSVAFSLNGNRLVIGSDDGSLRLWDSVTREALQKFQNGHESRVSSVAFSPDGSRIVSGSNDGTLRLWDATTGEPLRGPIYRHKNWVSSVAFSPDGSRIVSGSDDGTLRLWDATTGESFRGPMYGHKRGISSVAFSPDGSRIVSGSDDGTLRLWDGATGEALGEPLLGHDGLVTSVAFSPDGSRIVSGSNDRTLRLWDATTGSAIGVTLRGHDAWVKSVAFSPDGSRIVSGGTDGTVRLWGNLPTGNILQVACRYLPNINGRPDTSAKGLATEIGIEGLSLPDNCDTYDPPLPPEFRR